MNSAKMYFSLLILLCLIGAVMQLKITTSYRTSSQCSDGSYALIGGANLTLEYNYGHNYSRLQSFHLYEVFTGRHMFDYEKMAGKTFLKDRDNRVKSYEWTDTGIKFMIPDINKTLDSGKYVGGIETKHNYKKKTIEIIQIFDPPVEVILNTPDSLHSINLTEGFGEYVLKASAESYTAITCNSTKIIWMSKKEELLSCQAKDYREATLCPLTLKESEMTAGECIRLEVYAEQYGVTSEKKIFVICYAVALQDSSVNGTKVALQDSSVSGTKADGCNMHLILGLVKAGVSLHVVIIVVIIVVILMYWTRKSRGHIQGSKNGEYQSASQADDSNSSKKQYTSEVEETEKHKLKEHIIELEERITELKSQNKKLELEKEIGLFSSGSKMKAETKPSVVSF